MNAFEEIVHDIEWRKEQLLIAKTLPFLYDYSDSHKEFLIKNSIPTIYAVWEGFVNNSFQIYARELNKLELDINSFCSNLVTHSIEMSFPQFKEYPIEFEKRMKFVNNLNTYLNNQFRISPLIHTESNVELEVLNRICFRFNLKNIKSYPYKQQLKDFLQFRNRIAHGDISLVVDKDNLNDFVEKIEEFILLVENLMNEILEVMMNGFNVEKSYLSS